MNIYSHFSRSAKRVAELKSYYEFYEQDYMVKKLFSLENKIKKKIFPLYIFR